jgi:hypothetical protein
MFPSERGDMGQQVVGNRRSLRGQLPDGTVEIEIAPPILVGLPLPWG